MFLHKLGKPSIVVVYVSTNISEELIKDAFYHAVQNTQEIISSQEISVVLKDVNVTLAPEARDPHIRCHIIGTAIIETTSNDDGE